METFFKKANSPEQIKTKGTRNLTFLVACKKYYLLGLSFIRSFINDYTILLF